MVDFIKDATITALITSDGARAFGNGDGLAGNISQALNGGVGVFHDKEDGLTYTGTGKVLTAAKQVLKYEYDFTKDGGAIGEVALKGQPLPKNFRITGGLVETIVAPVSAGLTTISVGTVTGTVANLLAATAKASFTAGSAITTIPLSIATSVKVTNESQPIINILVAALTAGKIKVFLEGYIVS